MTFVELNRAFLPLQKDKEVSIEMVRAWGHRYSGAIHWQELLPYYRVILLAEASSGKTEEFRNQAAQLQANGQAGFFVRIEELADSSFENSLDPGAFAAFRQWQTGDKEGWFFLDSIDEARLNRKSFETALKNLARALGPALNRCHIFISCRVSDWAGEKDRASIDRILPALQPSAKETDLAGDKLLDPIFKQETKKKDTKPEKKNLVSLQVFQICALSAEEYKLLASHCGVTDVTEFSNAVVQHQLDMFTERPGDVIELASYWITHKQFASFENMTNDAISLKLKEDDNHRADNGVLSEAKARAGAEIVAAALSLGKSFTLRSPSHGADTGLTPGAIDLALVLPGWSPEERNALSRRAVFAPATYGRIRFHHRTTQEFLAAKWLARLLDDNCPLQEVWDLLFVERYGVETVVPSLQAEAAWLALWNSTIRNEIARREPVALIRNGDPASLPIATRETLLAAFAAKQATGDVYNDSFDHRALWMFADPKLDKSIRAAWNTNPREDFRFDLLRIIREGNIYACADLALGVALNGSADKYARIVAIEVVKGEGKTKSLKAAAALFRSSAESFDSRVEASFAHALFPKYLTIPELLDAISRTQRKPKGRATDGIGYHLADYFDSCPSPQAKEEYLLGIAQLCLQKPFIEDHHRVSRRHYELAKGMEDVARKAVAAASTTGEPSPGTIAALMVVERAERNVSLEDLPSLRELVMRNQSLNRALFWADVTDDLLHDRGTPASRHWHIYLSSSQLWGFTSHSLGWLADDLKKKKRIQDKQIALSAIVTIYGSELQSHEADLRKLISRNQTLNGDLDAYLAPAEPHPTMRKWAEENAAREKVQAIQTEKYKKSWQAFSKKMQTRFAALRDPEALKGWKTGARNLYNLHKWLGYRTDSNSKSAKDWRLLAEGFGLSVAEAYRDGMKLLWRITEPENAERNPGGPVTVKSISTLSMDGLTIEASEDPDWASKLSEKEVERAFLHGAYSIYGSPDWLDDLLNSKESIVAPLLKPILEQEWGQTQPHHSPFLYRFGRGKAGVGPLIWKLLFDMAVKVEPPQVQVFDYFLQATQRVEAGLEERATLMKLARGRLKSCAADERRDFAIRYIGLMLIIDVDVGAVELADWIAAREPELPGYGEWAFGRLFDRHDPIIYGMFKRAAVPTLEGLLDLVYRTVRPLDDVVHEGSYTPGPREAAEGARDTILTALIDRPGPDAYWALSRLSASPSFKDRQHRFRELTRGKAEKDAELVAWSEADVVNFSEKHTRPVKTGHGLLDVVSAVLSDIQHALSRGDLAGRPLLQRAQNEDEMKLWLVEQMNFRAKGRFQAFREAKIAFGDKPDLIVASTTAAVEVGIELKHGGKTWTAKDFERSLRHQLAQDYLKPANRRHGIFVISNHKDKNWLRPVIKAKMDFKAVIAWLSGIAEGLTANDDGAIEVRVFGIDAVPKKHAQPHRAKVSTKPNPGGATNRRATKRGTLRTPSAESAAKRR